MRPISDYRILLRIWTHKTAIRLTLMMVPRRVRAVLQAVIALYQAECDATYVHVMLHDDDAEGKRAARVCMEREIELNRVTGRWLHGNRT